MSDKDSGKNEVKRIELDPFLGSLSIFSERAAYGRVILREPSDFICERLTGNEVGVELTKITRDPSDVFWDKVLDRKEHIEPYEALEYIRNLI